MKKTKEYITFIFADTLDADAIKGPHMLVEIPADASDRERLALLDAFEASGFKYMAQVVVETDNPDA